MLEYTSIFSNEKHLKHLTCSLFKSLFRLTKRLKDFWHAESQTSAQ